MAEQALPDSELVAVRGVRRSQAGSFQPSVSAHQNYSQQKLLSNAKKKYNTGKVWKASLSPATVPLKALDKFNGRSKTPLINLYD